jgi:hypothetical protein
MRYTEKDIPNIPLTEFMAALGEKPVSIENRTVVYYAPQRDDHVPMLWVDTKTNRWHDYLTDESGTIMELADLNMNGKIYNSTVSYILRIMNDYEQGKELSAMSHRPSEATIINLDIKNLPIEDFMKALGHVPEFRAGEMLAYKPPYNNSDNPTFLVKGGATKWLDMETGNNGNIYDLAYEMTGSCNRSELSRYITGQMQGFEKSKAGKVEQPKQGPERPKRKMRF